MSFHFIPTPSNASSAGNMSRNQSSKTSPIPIASAVGLVYYLAIAVEPVQRKRVVNDVAIPAYGLGVLAFLLVQFQKWRRRRWQAQELRVKVALQREERIRQQQERELQVRQKEQKRSLKDNDASALCLSGAYKLTQNHNYEAFLGAQGVPWALRAAANTARPTHRITHVGNALTIKIEGIIETQTTYTIEGPPVRSAVRGRVFEDAVTYWRRDDAGTSAILGSSKGASDDDANPIIGIKVQKRAINQGYGVDVRRRLSHDQKTLISSCIITFDDHRKDIACKQIFRRVE